MSIFYVSAGKWEQKTTYKEKEENKLLTNLIGWQRGIFLICKKQDLQIRKISRAPFKEPTKNNNGNVCNT